MGTCAITTSHLSERTSALNDRGSSLLLPRDTGVPDTGGGAPTLLRGPVTRCAHQYTRATRAKKNEVDGGGRHVASCVIYANVRTLQRRVHQIL